MRVAPNDDCVQAGREAFTLFKSRLLSGDISKLERTHGITRYRNRLPIFTSVVVLWLMIYQRLSPKHTQSAAVKELQAGKFNLLHSRGWQSKCPEISMSTSAYNQARKLMSVAFINDLVTLLINGIFSALEGKFLWHGRRAYLLDGSTFSAPHEEDLLEAFPGGRNQHGTNYRSVMLVLTAHELYTGIATVPTWGAMYGDNPTSEQKLTKEHLKRLPKGSIVIGDANFGTFAIALHIKKNNHRPLLRLTKARAEKILGRTLPAKNSDFKVVWKPSPRDRKTNPEINENDAITGRLIVATFSPPGKKSERVTLYLFTTLTELPHEIVELYLQRWNIETDLRSIKVTVDMTRLNCKSKDAVEKEMLTGFAAYALIRATMAFAATAAGKEPRTLSFSYALDVFHAYLPKMQLAKSFVLVSRIVSDMLDSIARSPIHQRKKKRRNQLRVIRPRAQHFPFSSKTRSELNKIAA
jgi:putative transposase